MGRSRGGDAEAAVSSVVGTVLMLGVTMAVFAGLAVFALDYVSETGETLRADLNVQNEGGRILLQHRGGDEVDLATGHLLLTVDGDSIDLPLTDLADQVADGATWRIGETLCIAGPQPPCAYDTGAVSDLLLVYDDVLVVGGLPVDESGPTLTYIDTAAPTAGTVTDLAAAQASSDGGAEATVTEAGTTGSVGSASSDLSGSSATSNSVTDPDNALAGALSGDLSDARAILDANDDWVEVTGFTVPSGATGITAVTIGFEGEKESSGGTSPNVLLSYKVSGVTGATTLSQTLSSTSEAHYTVVVTSDRSWTTADVTALSLRVQVTNSPNKDAGIDHLYATVQYSTAPTTTYALDVRMDFTSVPAAASHLLRIGYRTTGDSFLLQVWDGSAYHTRGTLGSTPSTTFTYTLAPGEENGGAPRLRFIDATPSGIVQGNLYLGYVRLEST